MPLNARHEFHHEIRQSSVILTARILLVEVAMTIVHLGSSKLLVVLGVHGTGVLGLTVMTWEVILFHSVNIVVLLTVVLAWANASYALTERAVCVTTGVFHKKRTSFDISSIESAAVSQGIFGRIFDYGTVYLKSPLFHADVYLKNVPSPHYLVNLLENQRAQETSAKPVIIPPKHNPSDHA